MMYPLAFVLEGSQRSTGLVTTVIGMGRGSNGFNQAPRGMASHEARISAVAEWSCVQRTRACPTYRITSPSTALVAGWRSKQVGTFDTEFGYSTMGYEISGGLGAKMARPDTDVVVFVVMALVLLVRPTGLFGRQR